MKNYTTIVFEPRLASMILTIKKKIFLILNLLQNLCSFNLFSVDPLVLYNAVIGRGGYDQVCQIYNYFL